MIAVHIRKKALSRGPRQTRDTYGAFDGDPQRRTLCGAASTTQDHSWAETRHAGPRVYVTCEACKVARESQP